MKTLVLLLLFSNAKQMQAQVPLLNSHSTATAVILLDFDGHVVDGTSWNYNGPINCGASGLDNIQIENVFNRVAEDYRPFNVNVTTDEAKFLAAPATNRMRVLLTVSHQWYGSSGGVAFLYSFTWGDDTPCFVFTSLLNYNVKNIAEASAHEAGHTLGLQHQSTYNSSCVKTSEYNYGDGTGEIGWAPIMGAGYYQNLTLWNSGKSSAHCDSIQNDLSIITGNNGFGFRADDHGNTFATSTNAAFVSNQFNVNGIVNRNTDQDIFRFVQPATGRFQLSAVPYNVGAGNVGSDLDMQVTLYNGSFTQLNIFNPGTLLSSVVDTTLNAGTYYLKVEGKGNIYAPNYASLGSYSLRGNFVAGTLPLRRLELTGQVITDQHKLSWVIDADEIVTEQVLEVSIDGRNFTPVTSPAAQNRTFLYRPYVSSPAQYRLHVTFDDRRDYYSNIVVLRNTSSFSGPKLTGNLISQNLSVSSPGNFTYTIYEVSGRTAVRGQLSPGLNNLSASAIGAGSYLIRFTNGKEQWIEKFVKQ